VIVVPAARDRTLESAGKSEKEEQQSPMGMIQDSKEQAFVNQAVEAHRKGSMIFVGRIMVAWRDSHGWSTSMPTIAGQIEAIERVGSRLEQFSETTQSSIGANKQGAFCAFRRHDW
jgi:hypothetical protein